MKRVQRERRARRDVHAEPEDVRPVVVASRIEQPARRAHVAEIDFCDEDGLLVAHGPGHDLAVGIDDHAVAGLDPAIVLALRIGPHALPVRQVRGNLIGVQA
jgi:hypothetical protein